MPWNKWQSGTKLSLWDLWCLNNSLDTFESRFWFPEKQCIFFLFLLTLIIKTAMYLVEETYLFCNSGIQEVYNVLPLGRYVSCLFSAQGVNSIFVLRFCAILLDYFWDIQVWGKAGEKHTCFPVNGIPAAINYVIIIADVAKEGLFARLSSLFSTVNSHWIKCTCCHWSRRDVSYL